MTCRTPSADGRPDRPPAGGALREGGGALAVSILEGLPDALFVLAAETGIVLDCNPAASVIFGYPRADLVGGSLEVLHPSAEAFADFEREVRDGLVRDGFLSPREVTLKRRDGRCFPAEYAVFSASAGRLAATVHLIRDLTERRRSEERLRQVEERIRQAQKLEAIGALAGGIAHEFNNLLMGITCCTHFLLRAVSHDPEAQGDLMQINRLAERGASLTRQLLAFSRRQSIEPVRFELNTLIKATLEMLRRLVAENVEIRFLPSPDVGEIRADPAQIEQVLANLVVNACEAMPDGGVLTIRTERIHPSPDHLSHLSGPPPEAFTMLAVSDTGRGMDEETRSRIFEPFFTTKGVGEGVGLGLSVAHGIVEQHGGFIEVESTPGAGTTVKVFLPAALEHRQLPTTQPLPGGRECVLVVDDEEVVREMLTRVLMERGYRVLSAASAEEAETLLQGNSPQPDLLLTDVVMPGVNGRDLARRLAERFPAMKTIYMSGYPDAVVGVTSLTAEGSAFIAKPINPVDLLRRVRQVLDERPAVEG